MFLPPEELVESASPWATRKVRRRLFDWLRTNVPGFPLGRKIIWWDYRYGRRMTTSPELCEYIWYLIENPETRDFVPPVTPWNRVDLFDSVEGRPLLGHLYFDIPLRKILYIAATRPAKYIQDHGFRHDKYLTEERVSKSFTVEDALRRFVRYRYVTNPKFRQSVLDMRPYKCPQGYYEVWLFTIRKKYGVEGPYCERRFAFWLSWLFDDHRPLVEREFVRWSGKKAEDVVRANLEEWLVS